MHVLNISALYDTCTLLFLQTGRTPLHHAADNGYLDTVKYLIHIGADVSVLDNVSVIINW